MLIEHGQIWEDRGARGLAAGRRLARAAWRSSTPPAVAALLAAGFVVVANGGGGIPVVRDPDGTLRGVEAVIDKDLGAALLARTRRTPTCWSSRPTWTTRCSASAPRTQRPIGAVDRGRAARRTRPTGEFASGSMGPKVEAVCRFVEAGGQRAAITLPGPASPTPSPARPAPWSRQPTDP